MNDWVFTLREVLDRHAGAALLTVVETAGSAPREAGARMIVTGENTWGTIGGGHLEYKAIEAARQGIAAARDGEPAAARLLHFPLGPSLGQCCGGNVTVLCEPVEAAAADGWLGELAGLRRRGVPAVVVTSTGEEGEAGARMIVTRAGATGSLGASRRDAKAARAARAMLADGPGGARPDGRDADGLLFELVRPPDFDIFLFGAGHVGKALVSILAGLPCAVTWIDGREDQFPANVPPNVAVEHSDAPERDVDDAPPGAYFLVMTHSHQLDALICERILKRGDFRYLGLIGSKSKRKSFETRLGRRGIGGAALGRMTCPIGIGGISGKTPAEIAVAVAAQILQVRETARAGAPIHSGNEVLSA